eukprot:m.236228 g.236228  ORF g.236228 m.236228 type:complete len:72 (-) comp45716_c0_seq1:50-265(-)
MEHRDDRPDGGKPAKARLFALGVAHLIDGSCLVCGWRVIDCLARFTVPNQDHIDNAEKRSQIRVQQNRTAV